MPHAKMTITVNQDIAIKKTSDIAPISVAMEGCMNCLEHSITLLMVSDTKFREMINRSGKDANRIRRGEGPSPSVNPHNN